MVFLSYNKGRDTYICCINFFSVYLYMLLVLHDDVKFLILNMFFCVCVCVKMHIGIRRTSGWERVLGDSGDVYWNVR